MDCNAWQTLPARRAPVCIRLAVLGLAVFSLTVLSLTVLSLTSPAARAEETAAERQARLRQLTVEQRLELERKRERFDALPEQEQNKLRELHAELAATPNAAQLQETLARYTAWLNTLTSGQRAELLTMKCDERIGRIKELMRQQEIVRFRTFVEGNLPTEDRDAIYKWVTEYAIAHREEIEKRVPGNERWRLRDAKDEAGRARLLAFWLQFQMRDPQHKLPATAMEEIVPQLSQEAQQQIAKAQTPEEKQKRLEDLIRAAVLSHAVPRASDEELRKFYAELPVEARARLEGLEGEELKNELRRMYNFARFRWGPGRGPGGPGGPGGRREVDRGRGGPPRDDDHHRDGRAPGVQRPDEHPRNEQPRSENPRDGHPGNEQPGGEAKPPADAAKAA